MNEQIHRDKSKARMREVMGDDIRFVNRSNLLRGAAAMHAMLDIIGEEGRTDHDLARIFVDDEIAIRAFLKFAIEQLGKLP